MFGYAGNRTGLLRFTHSNTAALISLRAVIPSHVQPCAILQCPGGDADAAKAGGMHTLSSHSRAGKMHASGAMAPHARFGGK